MRADKKASLSRSLSLSLSLSSKTMAVTPSNCLLHESLVLRPFHATELPSAFLPGCGTDSRSGNGGGREGGIQSLRKIRSIGQRVLCGSLFLPPSRETLKAPFRACLGRAFFPTACTLYIVRFPHPPSLGPFNPLRIWAR